MPLVVFMFNIHCWSWVKGWLSSNLANWCSTMHIKRGGLRSVRKCLSSNCCIFVVKLLYLFSSHILWRCLQRKYNKDNRKNTRTKRKIPAPSWHKIQQVCRRLLEICWGNSAVSDPYLVYTVFKFIPKQVHVWTKWRKGMHAACNSLKFQANKKLYFDVFLDFNMYCFAKLICNSFSKSFDNFDIFSKT